MHEAKPYPPNMRVQMFKITNATGAPVNGGRGLWLLPEPWMLNGGKWDGTYNPGAWMPLREVFMCNSGYHLCPPEYVFAWCLRTGQPDLIVWHAEFDPIDPVISGRLQQGPGLGQYFWPVGGEDKGCFPTARLLSVAISRAEWRALAWDGIAQTAIEALRTRRMPLRLARLVWPVLRGLKDALDADASMGVDAPIGPGDYFLRFPKSLAGAISAMRENVLTDQGMDSYWLWLLGTVDKLSTAYQFYLLVHNYLDSHAAPEGWGATMPMYIQGLTRGPLGMSDWMHHRLVSTLRGEKPVRIVLPSIGSVRRQANGQPAAEQAE